MKIKSKLIAGGLMTTVACALVGSITGTFAWIQYSNNATASIHGISVQTNQILQLKLEKEGATWFDGNLSWNYTGDQNRSIVSLFNNDQLDDSKNFKLTPVSNGKNDGNSALIDDGAVQNPKTVWYGNPDGISENLPTVESGAMQFSFRARLKESNGSTDSYPNGKLYVTDIAAKVWENAEAINNQISFALRMHVQLGEGENAKFFVVNPTKAAGETTELSAVYSKETKYDFTTKPISTINYQLPQERYTTASAETENTTNRGALKAGVPLSADQAAAYNAAFDPARNKAADESLTDTEAAEYNETLTNLVSEGQFIEQAGNLVALQFANKGGANDILPGTNAAGELVNGKFVNITGAATDADAVGVKVVVTVWLEGFAIDPSTAVEDNPSTVEDESVAAHNWWNFNATIGKQIATGFELTGIKTSNFSA